MSPAAGPEAEVLVRILAPHFVAGVVARDGRVIEAAPIVGFMRDWDGRRLAGYCERRGWRWERVVSP